jgi:hypothetical protein
MADSTSATQQRVDAVGFPDFWQHVHDKFPKFFGAASAEVILIGNEAFKGLLSRPIDKLARHISRSVWNSFGSVMLLALNGCGVDAMKLGRGMFEASVTLGYLRLHQELADDFLDYHFVIQKQRNDFMREHAPEQLKRVSEDLQKEIEDGFARVAPKFRNRDGKIRLSWSKVSIREMAKAVGKEKLYLAFYRFASSMHHSDIGGLFAQLEALESDDVLDVDLVPSDAWLKEALIISHGAVISVLRDYSEITNLGNEQFVERADKSFLEAWGTTEAAST